MNNYFSGMKISRYLFIITLLFLLSSCNAFKKGYKKFEVGQYDVAINHFERALKKNTPSARTNFFIAESYRLSNRLKEAAPYYKAALDQNIEKEEAAFYYGYALKANGEYKAAENQFANYVKTGTEPEYLKLANKELSNLRYLSEILAKESFYEISNAVALNTEATEYSPVFNNGEVYFTSNRGIEKIYKTTGTPFTNIFKAKMNGPEIDPATVQELDALINTPAINEGAVTFSRDGNTMVFARGNSGKRKGTQEVNLYITRYRNGEWSDPEFLNINDPSAWDSTPAFSSNGRILYFASNRRGGYGGIDLYSATMNANGRFGNVKNMGSTINTANDEMFPLVSDDGKLYFSSSGHPGLGGLDLFVAIRKDNLITIENLGVPINSPEDDFGMYYLNPMKGFFVSNREGGKGDDDIYTFIDNSPEQKIVNYYLTGITVTTDSSGTEEILPQTRVQFLDEEDNLIAEQVTDTAGRFMFKVDGDRDYFLIGDKEQYFTTRESFSTVGKTIPKEELTEPETDVTFETKINLDRIVLDKAIVLDNIYYDLDKADIRPDAAVELDKLVQVLQDNPEIKIELSSHTDSRAPDDYNIDLSQRRAESAVNYIISQGIDKNRIRARGYGETRLIIADATTEEEHQVNRRTEFKVYEYNKDTGRLEQIQNSAEEEPEEEVTEETNETEEEKEIRERDESLEESIDWEEDDW